VLCRQCAGTLDCPNCSVSLVIHGEGSARRARCHYCNYSARVPSQCPLCAAPYLDQTGFGTERVEAEVQRSFAQARVARLDRDAVRRKGALDALLARFRRGDIDVLVGTQMIAKGHDIPNVTLVGAVNADVGLGLPDFRAGERTFQLLTQAAGRAGRGSLPGIVLIQTSNPDHYAIRYASRQDYPGFYEKEMQFRRAMRYPPFAALANVLVRSEQQDEALRMATELGVHLMPPPEELRVLGPAEAPVPRLKNEFRYQLLLKSASRKRLNAVLNGLREFAAARKWNATALVIDVDPISLL
jgi:primosomal protein N' (replication factor Y)